MFEARPAEAARSEKRARRSVNRQLIEYHNSLLTDLESDNQSFFERLMERANEDMLRQRAGKDWTLG
jgi:hypothetical protein